MNNDILPTMHNEAFAPKQPAVGSIEDVLTFKLNRLVTINEREGHRWSGVSFDLSLNEWRVLAVIQAKAPVRAGDVSALLLMDKSQLSRLIKDLQEKLFIKSKSDANDARAVVLTLTSIGTEVYDDMLAEVLRKNEQVFAPLSVEEVKLFDDMLNRLTAHNLSMLEQPM